MLLQTVPIQWPLQFALPGMLVTLPDHPTPIAIKVTEFFLDNDGEVRDVVHRLEDDNGSQWGYVEYTLSDPKDGPVVITETRLTRRVKDAEPFSTLNGFQADFSVIYDDLVFVYDGASGGVNQNVSEYGNLVSAEGFSRWVSFKAEVANGTQTHVLTYADWGQDPPLAAYVGIVVEEGDVKVHLAPLNIEEK